MWRLSASPRFERMERLTGLPIIGNKLADNLEKAGISTPDQLRAVGAEAGIRKSLLPPERKAELKRWFREL